jgi:hypothetical protein
MKALSIIMTLLFFCSIASLPSCNGKASSKGRPDFSVPASYYVECLQEAIDTKVLPDTILKWKETPDSVIFTTETVRNCCGWFDGLAAARRNDTVLVVDEHKALTRTACDCICLFRETIAISRGYFLSSKETFLLNNKKIK